MARETSTLGAFQLLFEKKAILRTEGLELNVARCPARTRHEPHRHANAGIMFVLRGTCDELNGFHSYSLTPFMARFRGPGTEHEHCTGEVDALVVHLEFAPDWWENRDLAIPKAAFDGSGSRKTERLAIASMLSCLAGDNADLDSFAIEALSLFRSCEVGAPSWLVRAKEALDARGGESWSLRTLSAEVGISPMHLASTFRHRYGLSIGAYQIRTKLAATCATRLKGRSLGSSAIEAGFYDQAHFAKAFRKEWGATPTSLLKLIDDR